MITKEHRDAHDGLDVITETTESTVFTDGATGLTATNGGHELWAVFGGLPTGPLHGRDGRFIVRVAFVVLVVCALVTSRIASDRLRR
jgi:hypothetical protein